MEVNGARSKIAGTKITTVKKWKQNWRCSFSYIIKPSKKIKQLHEKGHFKISGCPTLICVIFPFNDNIVSKFCINNMYCLFSYRTF